MRAKFILILSLVLFFVGCKKDNESTFTHADLVGNWIEIHTKIDTIIFYSDKFSEMFDFRRGFEIRDGHKLPKYGADLYFYKLTRDSIYLNGMLSSSSAYKHYYFKMNDKKDEFQIGNFGIPEINTTILTFKNKLSKV